MPEGARRSLRNARSTGPHARRGLLRAALGLVVALAVAAGCTGFRSALARLPAVSAAPAGWEEYTVRRGDTLSSIARRHAASVQELARVNDLKDPDRIEVGQVLRVPPAHPEAPARADAPARPPDREPEPPRRLASAPTAAPTAEEVAREKAPEDPPYGARLAEARARTAHAESRFWAADYQGALREVERVGALLGDADLPDERATLAQAQLVGGMALAALGRRDAAVAHFRRALEEDPRVRLPSPPPPRIEALFEQAQQARRATP